MKTDTLIVGMAVVLCAGCTTLPTSPETIASSPPPAMIEPEVAPVSGTDLDPTNLGNVRVGESLKSYPVGRYVDPNDPNVMHEAHVVYRKEVGTSWNLNPNAPTVVPLGPVVAVADPAKTPDPLPEELEQKMAEQNQLVASLIEQNEALVQQLGKLGRELAEVRRRQEDGR